MCLIINKKIHHRKGIDRKPAPLVTHRPLLVWKYLERPRDVRRIASRLGVSPFRSFRYHEGVLYTANFRLVVSHVYDGLHAYRVKEDGQWGSPYPAIVPAGSQIYLSTDSDGFSFNREIVSTQLIVYRDMEALEAVHGKPDSGTKVSDACSSFLNWN